MPSQFETQMRTQLAGAIYPGMSLAATYTAPDGTVTAGLTVRVHRGDAHQVERASRASGEAQTGEIMVLQDDLPKPVKGGRFTVEGVEVWSVAMTPTLANGQFVCACTREGVDAVLARRAKNV